MTQSQALSILKTGANVFLTGEPGSGKTHVVNQYVAYLRGCGIEPAITASTGIAATHIGGMTIHSWSGIGIKTNLDKYDIGRIASNKYIVKRIRRAKILIIDEISMLLSRTLSMVDAVCREIKQSPEPFGGMQVVLVGDFFQLPPIVKTEVENSEQAALIEEPLSFFAYDSSAWTKANLIVCYLTEQYRQDDNDFLSILSSIRRNVFDAHHLRHIESRKIEYHSAPSGAPKFFSHNIDVDRVNNEMLAKLSGKPQKFVMSFKGPEALIASLKKGCLSPEILYLKVGASVMFTKNNLKEGFVNGTLGAIVEFDKMNGCPIVKTRNGRRIEVRPMDWKIEEDGKERGRITQLPLRLAWAITVHKSQGMSLDAAVMDLSEVFEFGQGYVALSRVSRLSGLYLLGWNERAFQVHPEVLVKDQIFRATSNEAWENFSKISKAEIQKQQKNFIINCGGKLKTQKEVLEKFYDRRKKKNDYNTDEETLIMWRAGKNISQIAEARALKESTILNHVEKLAARGKISHNELSHLLSPALSRALPEIHGSFVKFGADKLSPIFENFAGKYSYDELRIARIIYRNK